MFRCTRGSARASVWTAGGTLKDAQGFITGSALASVCGDWAGGPPD